MIFRVNALCAAAPIFATLMTRSEVSQMADFIHCKMRSEENKGPRIHATGKTTRSEMIFGREVNCAYETLDTRLLVLS